MPLLPPLKTFLHQANDGGGRSSSHIVLDEMGVFDKDKKVREEIKEEIKVALKASVDRF